MNQREIWKKAADYENLEVGDSVLLIYFGKEKYEIYDGEFLDIANAKSGVLVTKNLAGPHFTLIAQASLININSNNKGIEGVDFDILDANAQAEISNLYVGAGAELKLAGGSVSIFDLKLALGLETGVGIKDDSINLKFAGTGFTVGRKLGISVLGSGFGVDFGRIFHKRKKH